MVRLSIRSKKVHKILNKRYVDLRSVISAQTEYELYFLNNDELLARLFTIDQSHMHIQQVDHGFTESSAKIKNMVEIFKTLDTLYHNFRLFLDLIKINQKKWNRLRTNVWTFVREDQLGQVLKVAKSQEDINNVLDKIIEYPDLVLSGRITLSESVSHLNNLMLKLRNLLSDEEIRLSVLLAYNTSDCCDADFFDQTGFLMIH